jgi:hypothetical protein
VRMTRARARANHPLRPPVPLLLALQAPPVLLTRSALPGLVLPLPLLPLPFEMGSRV